MRHAGIAFGTVAATFFGLVFQGFTFHGLAFSGFAIHDGLPANAQAAAQQTVAPVRFAFGGNAAEIPAEFVENLIFIPVDINKSQPSLFVLDSAALASSVSPSRAAELGLAKLPNAILNFPG